MNDLVLIDNGEPVTTSRVVAERFGKQHSHVLKAIRSLDLPPDINASNFGLVDYLDQKGEMRPEYLMTKDGFTLLVMGFTGREAMKFKIEFINAFNAMEKALRSQATETARLLKQQEARITALENMIHGQPKHLPPAGSPRQGVYLAVRAYGKATGIPYPNIWGMLYDTLSEETGVNLKAHHRRGETYLQTAERVGMIETVEGIAGRLLAV